jgi:hypothetical protein
MKSDFLKPLVVRGPCQRVQLILKSPGLALSELPDLSKAIVRSSLLDEAFALGLKGRLTEMRERLDRLVERSSRKRELVCSSMARAGLAKLMAEDFGAMWQQISVRYEY